MRGGSAAPARCAVAPSGLGGFAPRWRRGPPLAPAPLRVAPASPPAAASSPACPLRVHAAAVRRRVPLLAARGPFAFAQASALRAFAPSLRFRGPRVRPLPGAAPAGAPSRLPARSPLRPAYRVAATATPRSASPGIAALATYRGAPAPRAPQARLLARCPLLHVGRHAPSGGALTRGPSGACAATGDRLASARARGGSLEYQIHPPTPCDHELKPPLTARGIPRAGRSGQRANSRPPLPPAPHPPWGCGEPECGVPHSGGVPPLPALAGSPHPRPNNTTPCTFNPLSYYG